MGWVSKKMAGIDFDDAGLNKRAVLLAERIAESLWSAIIVVLLILVYILQIDHASAKCQ
jgi:hypothetical protein